MDIEFSVDVVRGVSEGLPRAENDEYRMAMGIAGSLNEALPQATTNMACWLERDYKLNPSEVASVLGTSMSYDIAEMVHLLPGGRLGQQAGPCRTQVAEPARRAEGAELTRPFSCSTPRPS